MNPLQQPVPARDKDRSAVYQAQQIVLNILERSHPTVPVKIAGSTLILPPEAKFSGVDDVQRYTDKVLALPAVQQHWPTTNPIMVRTRKGQNKAHYYVEKNQACIAVPTTTRWALRELIILHEIAHHFSAHTSPPHGPTFRETYCDLVGIVMGSEVEFLLRITFQQTLDP